MQVDANESTSFNEQLEDEQEEEIVDETVPVPSSQRSNRSSGETHTLTPNKRSLPPSSENATPPAKKPTELHSDPLDDSILEKKSWYVHA